MSFTENSNEGSANHFEHSDAHVMTDSVRAESREPDDVPSSGSLKIVIAAAFLAVLGMSLFGWKVRDSIRQRTRQSLDSTLACGVAAVELWLAERREDADHLSAQADVHRRSLALLDGGLDESSSSELAATSNGELESLRAAVRHVRLSDRYLGWVLLDTSGTIVASGDDEWIDKRLPVPLDVLQKIENGGSTVSRPMPSPVVASRADSASGDSDVSSRRHSVMSQAGGVIMLAMSPVRRGVRPVGSLALVMDPMDRFSRILTSARTGISDETYAFDRNGMMISPSRFEHHLRASGLLPNDTSVASPMNIRLIDPGVDLTEGNLLPADWKNNAMTLMADQATRGATGHDVTGYRDYRGVPVVGVWQWLPEYGFGMTTQMDIAEAYVPVRVLRNALLSVFALWVGCVVVMFAFAKMHHRRTNPLDKRSGARRLGQYEIGDRIGSGGMGSVYHGRHHLLQRDVAVKVLEASDVTSKSLSRFRREVQSTSRLQHPNTIDIYDFGQDHDGTLFYVMEYVDGISLQQLVQRYGRQPPGRVIMLLIQICHSLAEAHRAMIIHRDVKPANILLTARAGMYDLVKVVDFGLVKQIDRETIQLTRSDGITGSPHYLSPEAIRDASTADARSDLYSVGAVGYFLLTGTALFESDSAADVCVKQLNEAPVRPQFVIGETLPEDLQNVLMSCLQKSPDDRPQNAGDLAEALGQCVETGDWSVADQTRWWDEFFHANRPRDEAV